MTTSIASDLAAGSAPSARRSGTGARSTRRRRGGRLAALAALAMVAVGCSSGPGSQEEFVEVLTRDGSLTEQEATCISEAVFDEYAEDQDALGKISAAPSFEFLAGDEGVPGFTELFDDTVRRCSTVGPTSE